VEFRFQDFFSGKNQKIKIKIACFQPILAQNIQFLPDELNMNKAFCFGSGGSLYGWSQVAEDIGSQVATETGDER